MTDINIFQNEILQIKEKIFLNGYMRRKYFLESINNLNKRINFVVDLILNKNEHYNKILCRICFWQNSNDILNIINKYNTKNLLLLEYQNTKSPGILIFESKNFNPNLFKLLLLNHFNFELAQVPSLNIRIQIKVISNKPKIFDIYDDRGMDEFFLIDPDVSSL